MNNSDSVVPAASLQTSLLVRMGVIKVGGKSQVLSKEVVLVFLYVALTHGPWVEVSRLSPVSEKDVSLCVQ